MRRLLCAGLSLALVTGCAGDPGARGGAARPESPAAKTAASPAGAEAKAPRREDEGPRIHLEVERADIARVVAEIAQQVGRDVRVAPHVRARVSVSLRSVPWRRAIALLAEQARCEVSEDARGALLLTQPSVLAVGEGGDVRAIVRLIAGYASVEVDLPPEVQGKVDMGTRTYPTWRDALKEALRQVGRFDLREVGPGRYRVVPRTP